MTIQYGVQSFQKPHVFNDLAREANVGGPEVVLLLKGVFTANPREGRAASGQRTDIWLADSRDQVNKLEICILHLTFDLIFWSTSYFRWLYQATVLYHILLLTFHFHLQNISSCLFKVFFIGSSCSRPICVEAITVKRANKSLPSEKLPESGQLPPNLAPGHQYISLLCPQNPWLHPSQWDP